MCKTIELELCCEAKPTNSVPHSIKVYAFVSPCAATRSSNPDPTTTMPPSPASHFPISQLRPQPQPPHPALPHHHHCANFKPSSATRHHTRVFHTLCAECVRLRHPPRVAGGTLELHAAQLTERLRRVQFERAVAAGPWDAFLGNAATELGIRECWVLEPDAVSWVSVPFGAAGAVGGAGGGCVGRGNRGSVEDGDGDDGLRWWTGRFGIEMWKVCKQAGETAFPHGIWGPCALKAMDMDDVGEFFVGRSRASCISTPCSSGGAPLD
ncbi:hypothetical protein DL768_001705 [Monosporascus sp. mg162]|nr:hypothetical protein DL768_001705 [Monosporascus sp. mg162]